jgi:hypothetical protein
MDEETLGPNAGYAGLQRDLADIAAELAKHVRERTGRAT